MQKSDPCKEPICFKNQGRFKFGKVADYLATKLLPSKELKTKMPPDYYNCPDDKSSLGNCGWRLLHTTAIYYPEKPTENDKCFMKQFVNSFAYLYPCKECSSGMMGYIEKKPPSIDSSEEISVWLCQLHNVVNKRIGKPEFDCSYQNLLKRWKSGFKHCKPVKL